MDVLDMSKALISIESVTPAKENALDFVSNILENMGFRLNRMSFEEQGSEFRVDNLYARFGDKGKNLCFAGHVDVVPPGDYSLWSYDPFEPVVISEDGKDVLYGRGSVDMKSAICAFICAVNTVMKTKSIGDNSISFMLTGDEECGTINGTQSILKWLKEKREKIDFCLLGEMTSKERVGDCFSIGRRGSMHFRITVYGKQGHIAYPENFYNPIWEIGELLNKLKEIDFSDGSKWFSGSASKTNLEVLDIKTNNKAENVIPSEAKIHFNIRMSDGYDEEKLKNIIVKLCDSCLSDYEMKTSYSGGAFVNTDRKIHKLINDSVKKVIGFEPKYSTSGGTSDARFMSDMFPTIELGMLEEKAHQVDESVLVNDLYELQKIYEEIIIRYFNSVDNTFITSDKLKEKEFVNE